MVPLTIRPRILRDIAGKTERLDIGDLIGATFHDWDDVILGELYPLTTTGARKFMLAFERIPFVQRM
ncbi:hypothetical protein A2635_03975 [Candidatus Peribacteria bacterium RIFCSPHIGHO2_01_FULL_51_9]|nr:MAG: hypothetical protein A2635_03975 [Candidatus Peribacteria bacterium RIFCSPHIGHO2_01_FULL_51_9]